MKLADLLLALDRLAPFQLAETWDRVGLQVGAASAEVHRLLVVLDVDGEALEEAERRGCEAVLAHHPIIFEPLTTVTDDEYPGAAVVRALRNECAIVAAHTNLDKARGGLADVAATLLGLEGARPIVPSPVDWLKVVGFVPADELDAVRAAMFAAGAGAIGSYEHCSFAIPGTGTFLPLEGARPTVGVPGSENSTEEVRLEVVLPRAKRRAVLDAFITAHSYEEPAYDVYELQDEIAGAGLGRVGYLPQPAPLARFVAEVAHLFRLPVLRYLGDPERRIRTVAVVPGSGASAIAQTAEVADVLLTGDVKYHEADEAARHGLALVDLPHEAAEGLALERWSDRLADSLAPHGVRVEFLAQHRRLWSYADPTAAPVRLGVDEVGEAEPNGVFELFVDGGARGNPGPAAIGARLLTDEGEVEEELADFIGHATNNVAEYQALIAGLEMALDHGARRLTVYTDSELVARQLNGRYKVREANLQVLHEQALRLLRELPDVHVKHIPREQNAEADRLVNRAIDASQGS